MAADADRGPERVILAPMEGLVDAAMRAVLTRRGGYDHCVTEFARVSSTPISRRRLQALCPELAAGARTGAGTPVRVQLLGSDPALMAESAYRVAEAGSQGVDLNFGCPAPCVNRHRGGAALLAEPRLLHEIVRAVRAAVPPGLPVTAKMRLGLDDPSPAVECAEALAAGGAAELVVHARTRADGYRAPARWEWIGRIRERLAIPVVANGDVNSPADWLACARASGCRAVMIGRGALVDPLLARRLRGETLAAGWPVVLPAVVEFWEAIEATIGVDQRPGRLKQWLGMLGRRYPEASALFGELRGLRDCDQVTRVLGRHAETLARPLADVGP